MNKIRCILLGFYLLITNVAYPFEDDGWYFSLNTKGYSDYAASIIKVTSQKTNLEVPYSLVYRWSSGSDWVVVRELQEKCFSKDGSSWSYIKNAKTATIPNNVKVIEESLFLNNTAIEKVTVYANLSVIPDYTFKGCVALNTVYWPNAVYVGISAFQGCTSLLSMSFLPSSITTYHSQAFAVSGLETFDFGDRTEVIGKKAFASVNKPQILTLPNSVTTIDDGAFVNCTGLSLISLGDGAMNIGSYAFQYCENLKCIIMGKGLKSIGEICFDGCSNIQEIYISNPTPPNCAKGAFPEVVKKNATLYVPVGSFADYWSAPEWEDFNIVEKNFEPIVSIDVQDNFDIVKDTRARLPYTITPATASIPNLQFTSSDISVAEVSSDGFVQGKKAGTATITINSQDGTNLIKECVVTVKEPTITEFKLNTKSLTLQVNEQANLNVTIQPDNTNKTVVWSSDNNEIAVVKEKEGNAIVLARSVGEANIIVQSVEYPEISDTCHVLVVEDNRLVGDVNEDGLVDKTDADTLMDMLLNRIEKSESADVNKDGMVNGIDFVILTKKIR